MHIYSYYVLYIFVLNTSCTNTREIRIWYCMVHVQKMSQFFFFCQISKIYVNVQSLFDHCKKVTSLTSVAMCSSSVYKNIHFHSLFLFNTVFESQFIEMYMSNRSSSKYTLSFMFWFSFNRCSTCNPKPQTRTEPSNM